MTTGDPRRHAASRVAAAAFVVLAAFGAGTLAGPTAAYADDIRDGQWQLDVLDARHAWAESTGTGVIVAVVDSGVDANHPDLQGQVLPGIDLVDGSTDGRTDPVGHGTSVAALIAGRGDDSDGVQGLAYGAKILPVRVLDKSNRYDDAYVVAEGVQWAVDHGAEVINLSLGGATYNSALADALAYAFDRNVVVVACTGNVSTDGPTTVWYPAREPGVVAVAGLAKPSRVHGPVPLTDESLWEGSLTGTETVLAAPSADLLSARPNGDYWHVKGTSFAAPLVSATAALVRSKYPDMSAGNVVQRLTSTAGDLGVAGRDEQFGFGLVNPVEALRADVAVVTSANPLDDKNPPPGVAGFGRRSGKPSVTPSHDPVFTAPA